MLNERTRNAVAQKLFAAYVACVAVWLGVSWGGFLIAVQCVHAFLIATALVMVFAIYNRDEGLGRAFVRWPLTWIAAAYFLYVVVQGLNVAYVAQYGPKGLPYMIAQETAIAGLPSSVSAPFLDMNAWRVLFNEGQVFLWACALWLGLRTSKGFVGIVWAVALTGGVSALLGMANAVSKTPFSLYLNEYFPSWFGTFSYANHAAGYYYLALACTLGLLFHYEQRVWSGLGKSTPIPVLLVLCTELLLAIGFTGSRTGGAIAVLLVLAAVAYHSVLLHKRKRLHRAWTGACLAAGVLCVVVFGAARHHSAAQRWRALSELQSSLEVQPRYWIPKAAADMVAQRPLYGWGAGSFRYAFPSFQERYPALTTYANTDLRMYFRHAHNDYAEQLIELGLVGCLLKGSALVVVVGFIVRFRRYLGPISVMLGAGVVGLLLHAAVDFIYPSSALALTGTLLLALCCKDIQLRWRRNQ